VYISYDQWMQRTNLGVLSVRSASLKSVDRALKNYDVFPSARHLAELRSAFDRWKRDKADWKKSDRYAGILTSGANAIYQFGKLAQAASRWVEVRDCRSAVREGDPGKAVDAIARVLSRDMTRRATQGTMSGFEAIARGAATTVGGPAAETIAAGVMSLAKLTFQVYVIGRDFQEKRQANGVMAGSEPVTYTVFDRYPLLGCYYVVCVDTSDVVNFMLDDIGTDNWMDAVEKLTRKMQPIVQTSRKLIDEGRFEIAHMPKMKKVEFARPQAAARGDYTGRGAPQPAMLLE
jgi:hypothetical protein